MLNTVNFSLQDCECGITLDFPNPSGTLKRKEEYLVYFDIQSSLPADPPSNITITPKSYIISGTNNFIPKTIIKVKSIHRGQTQSLIKLDIKDRYNQLLYNDYIRLVCSPQSIVMTKGTPAQPPNNIGSNGGLLLNLESTAELDIGMSVEGTNIPPGTTILSINSITQIELSVSGLINSNILTTYKFTRTTTCLDPKLLLARSNLTEYLVLDKTNDWTYQFSDKTLVKFIREDITDDTISVILPTKNKTTLPADDKKSDIPAVSLVYATGRVNNDQYCIS